MARVRCFQYKARRHFRKRLEYRFGIKTSFAQELEKQLMSELFIGCLKIVENTDQDLKIHYPAIHNKCILIFSKESNTFITGYPANGDKQRRWLI